VNADDSIESQSEVARASEQARTCGLCRGYNLGAFEDQHTITSVAYERLSRWKPDFKLDADGVEELRVIIYATEQLVNSIQRDWRGSSERNSLLSDFFSMLSHCYQIMYRNTKSVANEHAMYRAAKTGMSSLRAHDRKSIARGVSSQQFFHQLLVHQYTKGNHEFASQQLPVVLEHLCTLIDNIGSYDVDGVRSTANVQLHHDAQERLAEILTGGLFHYVVANVDVKHEHPEPIGTKLGVFPWKKVYLLEQMLTHKESFKVFVDKGKVERMAELTRKINALLLLEYSN